MEIVVKNLRETEKAINFDTLVCWANGNAKVKNMWMPKSCVKVGTADEYGQIVVSVVDWFVNKVTMQNQFNGYNMEFVNASNE